MSEVWGLFDEDADDRAEQKAVDAEIAAAERTALDAIRQISGLVERNPVLGQHAGAGAIRHIATIAGATANTLYKRQLDRDEQRRRNRVKGAYR
jgi:hypothetical protein